MVNLGEHQKLHVLTLYMYVFFRPLETNKITWALSNTLTQL